MIPVSLVQAYEGPLYYLDEARLPIGRFVSRVIHSVYSASNVLSLHRRDVGMADVVQNNAYVHVDHLRCPHIVGSDIDASDAE